MTRYLAATALLSVLAAGPAFASFTLVTPEQPAPAQPAITPAPMAPVAAAPIMPPASFAAPVQQTQIAPMAPAPVMPQPMAMTSSAPDNAEPVRGFGKDIPLVIAAQQIAPANREIAFGQGVDPSMPVSWKGGKAWRSVLSDALGNRGLQVAEQGNILFISRSSTATASNASLMMEPKYVREETQPAPVASSAQPVPTYLPPIAQPAPQPVDNFQPAPQPMVMPPANNNFSPAPVVATPMVMPPAAPASQPPMVMPPVQSVAPVNNSIPQAPVIQPMAAPVEQIAPAPQIMVGNNPVLPPQPLPAPTVIEVPVAPPPIPLIASQPEVMPAAPSATSQIENVTSWTADAGKTLKQALEDWSRRSNVTLRWDSEFDYPIQSSVSMNGDFESAVRTLLRGFSSAQPQPVARLYRPTDGAPGVLLVTTRGNDMSMGK